MQSLCHEIKERAIHVNDAKANGIPDRPQIARIPGNSAQNDNAEWAAYATLPADARMRNSFLQFYLGVARMLKLAEQRDPRIVQDKGTLKDRLQDAYAAASRDCSITYINSASKAVTLTLNDVAGRLFALDFDPYHCIERRWGAGSAEELASCKDDETKTRWYKAEQVLRNQVDAGYVARQAISLAEMEKIALTAPAGLDVDALIRSAGEKMDIRFLTAAAASETAAR
jgi:hypothetical protein